MKTINLDLPVAERELLDIDLGEQFFTIQKSRDGKVVAVGSFDDDGVYKVNGYFFERDGELVDEEFSDEYFQHWINVALGNDVEELDEEVEIDYDDLPFHHPDYMNNYKGGRI